MTTREKLIEMLFKSLCKHIHKSCKLAENIADDLIAEGVTILQWIPVTERLPKNDYGKHWKERQYYLVRVKPSGLMYVAHYGFMEHDWWIDDHDCVLSAMNFKEVTHWMPLPEEPKE